jgi:(R,R)-butanediol dehydrogenase/meso-butanediol dehydrogenase/diacetyl reductase
MRAALITGRGRVELREFPEPIPRPDGVVVEIAYCGVCGTDVHAWTSGDPYRPAICGHEWSGVVRAAGAEVEGLSDGDPVVVGVPPPCGRCAPCRAGLAEHCSAVLEVLVGRDPAAPPHGGFAPAIAVPAGRVVRVDAGLAALEPAVVDVAGWVRGADPTVGSGSPRCTPAPSA